jgi:hypothetical protein
MAAEVGVIPRVTGWHGTSQLHPYFVCDVFSSEPLEGNQLGVWIVMIPDLYGARPWLEPRESQAGVRRK